MTDERPKTRVHVEFYADQVAWAKAHSLNLSDLCRRMLDKHIERQELIAPPDL